MRTYCLVYFLAFAMFGPVVFANGAEEVRPLPKRQEGTFVALDFRFQSGETLPELKLAYTTLGTPQRDSSGNMTNAVLLLRGTTGTGANWLAPSLSEALFREGQPPDIRGQGSERLGVDAVPPRNWITPSLPEETNQIPNDDRQSCASKTVSEQKAHRGSHLTDFLTHRQFAFLPKSHPQPSLKRAVLVIFGFLSVVADTSYITAFATKKNLCLT